MATRGVFATMLQRRTGDEVDQKSCSFSALANQMGPAFPGNGNCQEEVLSPEKVMSSASHAKSSRKPGSSSSPWEPPPLILLPRPALSVPKVTMLECTYAKWSGENSSRFPQNRTSMQNGLRSTTSSAEGLRYSPIRQAKAT